MARRRFGLTYIVGLFVALFFCLGWGLPQQTSLEDCCKTCVKQTKDQSAQCSGFVTDAKCKKFFLDGKITVQTCQDVLTPKRQEPSAETKEPTTENIQESQDLTSTATQPAAQQKPSWMWWKKEAEKQQQAALKPGEVITEVPEPIIAPASACAKFKVNPWAPNQRCCAGKIYEGGKNLECAFSFQQAAPPYKIEEGSEGAHSEVRISGGSACVMGRGDEGRDFERIYGWKCEGARWEDSLPQKKDFTMDQRIEILFDKNTHKFFNFSLYFTVQKEDGKYLSNETHPTICPKDKPLVAFPDGYRMMGAAGIDAIEMSKFLSNYCYNPDTDEETPNGDTLYHAGYTICPKTDGIRNVCNQKCGMGFGPGLKTKQDENGNYISDRYICCGDIGGCEKFDQEGKPFLSGNWEYWNGPQTFSIPGITQEGVEPRPVPLKQNLTEPVQPQGTEGITGPPPEHKLSEIKIEDLTEEERQSEKERLDEKIRKGDFTLDDIQRRRSLDSVRGIQQVISEIEAKANLEKDRYPPLTFEQAYGESGYSGKEARKTYGGEDLFSVGQEKADQYRTDVLAESERLHSENPDADNAFIQLKTTEYAYNELVHRFWPGGQDLKEGTEVARNFEEAYGDKIGVCRHCAAALNDALRKTGIDSNIVVSKEHVWVRVSPRGSNGTVVTTFDLDPMWYPFFYPLSPRELQEPSAK